MTDLLIEAINAKNSGVPCLMGFLYWEKTGKRLECKGCIYHGRCGVEASEAVDHCDSCYWRKFIKDPDDLIQDHCEVCKYNND